MGKKPLSLAVEELNQGKIKILAEDEVMEEQEIYDRVEAPSQDQVQDLEDGQEEALDESENGQDEAGAEDAGDGQETEQEA